MKDKYYQIIALIVIALLIIINIAFNFDPYLWFDEAGQFWISKGLNHDSAPMSAPGSIWDVIVNNHDYNLDPGGFSILLHFWSMISNHYIWLRLLPFLFFLLTIFCTYTLTYKWSHNKALSSIICLYPIIQPLIAHESVELRAYSMEVLGGFVGLLAIESITKNQKYSNLLLWALGLSFFMTSRYSFIIIAFVVSLYILYIILRNGEPLGNNIKRISLYSTPLFITLFLIYEFSLKYQNANVGSVSYLPYLNTNPSILLQPHSILLLALCIFNFFLALRFWQKEDFDSYHGLLFVTLSSNILFLGLSFLGFHPWSGNTTRCISIIVLSQFCTITLLCYAFHTKLLKPRNINVIFCFMILLCFAKGTIYVRHSFKRDNALVDFLSVHYTDGKVYVDRWESPTMRYQFEYGSLKGYKQYPDDFTFVTKGKHRISTDELSLSDWYAQTQPDLNELLDYSLLIAPELAGARTSNNDKWISIKDKNRVWIQK